MTGPKIKSVPGLFGTTKHYDEHGRYLGYSQPGLFGSTNHYDASGRNVGYSQDALLGGQNHYARGGEKIGYTVDTILGESHHGINGERGYSTEGLFGTTTSFSDSALFDEDHSDANDMGDFDGFDW